MKQVRKLLDIQATVLSPGIDLDNYLIPRDIDGDAVGFYAAGLIGYKGDEVVNAIIRKLPKRKFFIVGRKFEYDSPTVPANVTFCGFQSDMREFYGKIKIILVPSLVQEGFSRIILEAAANGIPAIANNVGGIPEALGDSGVLIDLDSAQNIDIDHLANRYVDEIERLFDNPAAYEILSQKALQRAQHYATDLEHDLRLFLKRHVQ